MQREIILGHVPNRETTKLVSGSSGLLNLPFCAFAVANTNVIYGKDLEDMAGGL